MSTESKYIVIYWGNGNYDPNVFDEGYSTEKKAYEEIIDYLKGEYDEFTRDGMDDDELEEVEKQERLQKLNAEQTEFRDEDWNEPTLEAFWKRLESTLDEYFKYVPGRVRTPLARGWCYDVRKVMWLVL